MSIDSTSVRKANWMEMHRKTMHSGVSGAVGQTEIAKTTHRFDLNMEIKYIEIQKKTMHSGVSGGVGQGEIAKTAHRFDLSMESKMY